MMIENLHAKHLIFFFSPVKTFKARASKSLVLMALKVNVLIYSYGVLVGHTFFDQIIFFGHAKSTIFVPRKHGNYSSANNSMRSVVRVGCAAAIGAGTVGVVVRVVVRGGGRRKGEIPFKFYY